MLHFLRSTFPLLLKNDKILLCHFGRDALHIIENETRGFFTNPGLEAPQARCIYLTAIQLLRIAGAQNSLRPMLEALFHRMLLLPLPQNRADPLKCVKEIFRLVSDSDSFSHDILMVLQRLNLANFFFTDHQLD